MAETGERQVRRKARLVVMGAGLIGKRHIEHVAREAELAAVVDPSPAAREIAEAHGAPWFPSLAALLDDRCPDGVIIATPNQLHIENGMECVAAGLPMLIEKPIADDVASAETLVARAEEAGVPILVGHHRRHNPLIRRAREEIQSGRIGTVIAVHGMCWFCKPDDYFDVQWRRQPGAGPVFLNLIHDIDLLRYLCGDVVSVQALESNAIRGNPVEETAGILLRFRNGAIGTVTVSDAIVAPWSWELTAMENPAYPRTGQSCYMIGGTHGSLSIPDLGIWRNPGKRSWWEPIERQSVAYGTDDPLALQIRHFADVALGRASPLVSGREGLETLRVIAAVKEAARRGGPVEIG
ncbi:Gfo/Idh/MocA family protein [Mesorhizobium sp. AaZ16]|uniref:Gfo/Idh/MocA family protein n=1 Tax=Mesorhizobium sp. AaZ16 TaxID=3402289 RepID=UPI00374F8126